MPRKKKIETDEQVFKLPGYGPEARVTIRYDVNNPPPFFQPAPGVVIIGEHQCSDVPRARADERTIEPPRTERVIARGGNFEVDENDPAYLAFKARLGRGGGADPAPPDYSPPVITNDQINAEFEQRIGAQVRAETGMELDVTVPNVAVALKLAEGS